ncbi:MAG: peptidase M42, partial [Chromatocurvus sp.]
GQLDNVITIAALVYLFECGFEGTAFFTAQEEAGKSWRYLLEWFRRFGGSTNQLIVVDTSPFPTFDAAAEQHLVLRNRDANASFNRQLTERVAVSCRDAGYRALYKDTWVDQQNQAAAARGEPAASLGSTELGRIIAASNGLVDGTTLQIPTSGYHTMLESAPIASVRAFLDVLGRLSVQSASQAA